MDVHSPHQWDLSIQQAKAVQQQLAKQVTLQDQFNETRYIAGIDVGFEQQGSITRAAIALIDTQTLTPIESAIARIPTSFPYVPGYLSFRELPAIIQALKQLSQAPDLFHCDGQGIAHPRRFGIASHLGVITGIPAIGIAKTRLVGEYQMPKPEKGDYTLLHDGEEQLGYVLRSRTNVKPLFISPGHRISYQTAVESVQACLTKYKLPETTRWAHRLASDPQYREQYQPILV